MADLKIGITGASGRMGQAVRAAVEEMEGVSVGALHDQGEDLGVFLQQSEVVIDFTTAAFSAELVRGVREAGVALVMGTTGQEESLRQEIEAVAEEVPLIWEPNFSVGVHTLFWLTRQAARILGGGGYDREVIEMHHRHKIDAPSGTARGLLDILLEEEEGVLQHGREGMVGPREAREIGMHTLRGGDVVGDHTVIFAGEGERVELTHKASSRATFARGAVRAAHWLEGRKAGRYHFAEVLGIGA